MLNPIKMARENSGISQLELSVLTGIAAPRISNIENGITPTPSQIEKIANALNIDVGILSEKLNEYHASKLQEIKNRMETNNG